MSGEKEFFLRVENTFTAESKEDAVMQMAAWLADYSYRAGYRVWTSEEYLNDEDGEFMDAEELQV